MDESSPVLCSWVKREGEGVLADMIDPNDSRILASLMRMYCFRPNPCGTPDRVTASSFLLYEAVIHDLCIFAFVSAC